MNGYKKKIMIGCLAAALGSTAALSFCASETESADENSYVSETADVAAEEILAEASQQEKLYDGTYNLLLIGSDRRDSGWNGNSDTMILVTLNSHTESMYMVSFMRDTAANIPGLGTLKLNAAFANGGAELLEETLTSNFGVHIDNYASVDFTGIADIIDAVGGVDIEQSAAEIAVTNDYIHSLCEDWGLNPDEYYITESTTHLNGLQALAYMRDRYVGNDYARTERQRTVLAAVFSEMGSADPAAGLKLLTTVLTNVDTDMDLKAMITVAGYLANLSEYSLVTDRIPYDDLHGYSGEMLVPYQPDTNDRLLGEIYAKE